ncbi:hypothetical protein KAR91_72070 [Candidatus Pacearchaeota archaeon]|nr:hypothetical protein [Candidatus Pacearchaeota archaeon]
MINNCPFNLNQKIFELRRTPDPIISSTPSMIAWTVVHITDNLPQWSAIISRTVADEENPRTRTIMAHSWERLYHPNTASAVKAELQRNRELIDEFYITISSLKHYLYAVEGLGILINNNNKQGNPLEIDIH